MKILLLQSRLDLMKYHEYVCFLRGRELTKADCVLRSQHYLGHYVHGGNQEFEKI